MMRRAIRVLVLITELEAGGVQSVVLRYSEKLRKYNIVFDYVVQGMGDGITEIRVKEAGSNVYHVNRMTEHPLRFRSDLMKIIKQNPDYRIVHAHQNFLNIWSLAAAKKCGIKVLISHSHNEYKAKSIISEMLRMIIRLLFPVFVTDYWACSWNSYFWLYGKKYKNPYILHNAIDVTKYMYNPTIRNLVRKKYNVGDAFICICVGTLSRRKNQGLLLDVFSCLRNENMILWLVGDGDETSFLKEKAKQLCIEKNIVFMGNRYDVNELLQASDCFCLPSLGEGFPVSALEAQASGLPCILSTYITKEVAITDHVYYLSLDNINEWRERLLALKNNVKVNRVNNWKIISTVGYDIDTESNLLANKYQELYGRDYGFNNT